MNKVFPLATSTWDEREIAAMESVIASGCFTMGEKVREAERMFADYIHSSHAVMVNSGSSANLLMVASLFFLSENPLKKGDVVIVPAISWSTTYAPLQQLGLRVRFVDVDPCTLNLDLDQLDTAICADTRLIFAVNLLGNPLRYNMLDAVIAGRNITVIEDNCESLGAIYNSRSAGTFGLAGSFSTFFSHHISTMEGGFVVTDHSELYHIMLSVREHGWTRSLPSDNLVSGRKSEDWFEESFKFVLPGFNMRPLELSGVVAVEQIKKIPAIIRGRRENAMRFLDIASNFEHLAVQKEVGESSWFGFAIISIDNESLPRQRLRHALDYLGFEYRPIVAGNFVRNPVLEWFELADPELPALPVADHIHDAGLFVGNHHYSMDEAFQALRKLEVVARKCSL